MAELLVDLGLLYFAVGVLFATAFVTLGVGRVDSLAQGTGLGFRLIILPGCAALWPLLLLRWMGAKQRTA